jgi:hypothetical protein
MLSKINNNNIIMLNTQEKKTNYQEEVDILYKRIKKINRIIDQQKSICPFYIDMRDQVLDILKLLNKYKMYQAFNESETDKAKVYLNIILGGISINETDKFWNGTSLSTLKEMMRLDKFITKKERKLINYRYNKEFLLKYLGFKDE